MGEGVGAGEVLLSRLPDTTWNAETNSTLRNPMKLGTRFGSSNSA